MLLKKWLTEPAPQPVPGGIVDSNRRLPSRSFFPESRLAPSAERGNLTVFVSRIYPAFMAAKSHVPETVQHILGLALSASSCGLITEESIYATESQTATFDIDKDVSQQFLCVLKAIFRSRSALCGLRPVAALSCMRDPVPARMPYACFSA